MVADHRVDRLVSASAMSTSGPVGLVTVPAVAPSWPIATIASTFCVRAARLGVDRRHHRLHLERAEPAREEQLGVASVVKPTTPSLTPLT